MPTSTDSSLSEPRTRKRAIVVGLGMVGVAFIERLLKCDLQGGRDEWEIIALGEEQHVAYNRVGLTQYFAHRSIEALYLNPLEWYSSHSEGKLTYHLSDPVVAINPHKKSLQTARGLNLSYDECILATGSDAALPSYLSSQRFSDIKGAFLYRTIEDLDAIIRYVVNAPNAIGHKIRSAAVVGGGLLGLEAAKALLDLPGVDQVVLIERNSWVLSRQLDQEGGMLVLEKIKALGVKVLLRARVHDVVCDTQSRITGILLQDQDDGQSDQTLEIDMLVLAIGIKPRDSLAESTGLTVGAGGGFAVDAQLHTSLPNIYAVGECASIFGQTHGLIAPGVEMADVLAFNLTEGAHHQLREMKAPNVSTKLKLMGVDVASFGDYFADQGKLSQPLPGGKTGGRKRDEAKPDATSVSLADDIRRQVKSLTFRDPFADAYKKYIFTADGKYILGGMMVGDVKDYAKLVALCNKRQPIEKPPGEFIIGAKKDGEEEGDDLPHDAQICSCHNVSKGNIVQCAKEDGVRSFGEIKATTKCGTGCGGCVPLATSIFNRALQDAGVEVSNHVCKDFAYSLRELFQMIRF